jgi:hypothetical protein
VDVESASVLGSRVKGLISKESKCVRVDDGDECTGVCAVDRVSAVSN